VRFISAGERELNQAGSVPKRRRILVGLSGDFKGIFGKNAIRWGLGLTRLVASNGLETMNANFRGSGGFMFAAGLWAVHTQQMGKDAFGWLEENGRVSGSFNRLG